MNTFSITLDISKNHMKPNKLVTIGQGDKGGTTIVATVTDNGSVVPLTGLDARFVMRLPDGNHYVRENCLVQDGRAVYTVDESKAATVAGYTDEAYFELDTGTFVYSTERFRVKVLRAALDGSEKPQSWDDVDPSGGDDPTPPSLGTKSISANGTYNAFSDGLDGFSSVVVNVPNTYSLADEGKAVRSGALVQQGISSIAANSVYDTTYLSSVTVDVPNTYSAADEGKAVSAGALVPQSSSTVTANATYDTTYVKSMTVSVPTGTIVTGSATLSSNRTYAPSEFSYDAFATVTVEVPNTYSAADSGKVVSGSSLVQQGSATLSENSTYDTTYLSSVTVSVEVTPMTTSSLTASANGTYEPSSYGCDAFSQVVVNVEGGGGNAADFVAMGFSGEEAIGSAPYIHTYAFYYCQSLTTVSFPACTSIGNSAFISCKSLTTASFLVCTSIGSSAFYYCQSLTTVSFPACTSIGGSAFAYCSSLTTVSFPACTSIGSNAFAYCSSLTTVSFPACTSIGNSAFRDCSSLATAYFPVCRNIGNFAFASCLNLMSLYLTSVSSVPAIGTSPFSGTPLVSSNSQGAYGSVYVPSSLYDSFIIANQWSSISARIVSV